MTKQLTMEEYYGSARFKPIMTFREYVKRMVDKEAHAIVPEQAIPSPKPFTPPDTTKWSEVNIRAFIWSLMP